MSASTLKKSCEIYVNNEDGQALEELVQGTNVKILFKLLVLNRLHFDVNNSDSITEYHS